MQKQRDILELCFNELTHDRNTLRNLLLDEFIPYANRLYPEGWILEQDGATPHTARKTMEFFEEKNNQFLQWPPNSPDVSPIGNVWEILKNAVEQKNPKTKQELIEAIQSSKSVITREIERKFDEFCWKASKVL